MTESDPMDRLLRSSMAAPLPSLPPDFERRVMRAVRRNSKPLGGFHRKLLAGYGVVSVLVCLFLMLRQGLPLGVVAGSILGPLILTTLAIRTRDFRLRRTARH